MEILGRARASSVSFPLFKPPILVCVHRHCLFCGSCSISGLVYNYGWQVVHCTTNLVLLHGSLWILNWLWCYLYPLPPSLLLPLLQYRLLWVLNPWYCPWVLSRTWGLLSGIDIAGACDGSWMSPAFRASSVTEAHVLARVRPDTRSWDGRSRPANLPQLHLCTMPASLRRNVDGGKVTNLTVSATVR